MSQDVQVDPFASSCGLCRGMKIPIVGTPVRICKNCDGWPPRLDPPSPSRGRK